jgi:hypothetical protein
MFLRKERIEEIEMSVELDKIVETFHSGIYSDTGHQHHLFLFALLIFFQKCLSLFVLNCYSSVNNM